MFRTRTFFDVSFYVECDVGTFGHGCTEVCGKCKGKSPCNHTNGICVSGCAHGYDGLWCDKGKFLYLFVLVFFFDENISL